MNRVKRPDEFKKYKSIFIRKGTRLEFWAARFGSTAVDAVDTENIAGQNKRELYSAPAMYHWNEPGYVMHMDEWCVVGDDDPESNEYGEVAP